MPLIQDDLSSDMQISDQSLLKNQAYIDGLWVDAGSAERFSVTNPANGRVIAEVARCGAEETRRAIQAARSAQLLWRDRNVKERGRFFATEYAAIEPDLVTVAKGIAGGFPLSAVVGKAEIMDAPMAGGLGGTYGGSPLACAAALAVIELIKKEQLVDAARHIGQLFKQRLLRLQAQYPDVIGEVRAEHGAMIAIELVKEGDAEQPDPELTKELVARAYERGIAVLSCGVRGNVLRFLPALTISDTLIHEGMNMLDDCFHSLLKNKA